MKGQVQPGSTYGLLTVDHQTGRDEHGNQRWLCTCQCGSVRLVLANSLRSGDSTSCGCARSRRRRVDPDKVAQAVRLVGRGFPRARVALQLGVSTRWVSRAVCQAAGYADAPPPRRPLSQAERQTIVGEAKRKIPQATIARRLNLCPRQVSEVVCAARRPVTKEKPRVLRPPERQL